MTSTKPELTGFPRLNSVLQTGIDRRLHTTAQVYVAQDGVVQLNTGFGLLPNGQPVSAEHIFLWRSAGKPLLAALTVLLLDEAGISLDAAIGPYAPGANNGAETVMFRQILSHSTGWPVLPNDWRVVDVETQTTTLLGTRPDPSFMAYQPALTWLILTSALQEAIKSDVSTRDLLRQRIEIPLEMDNVQNQFSLDKQASLGNLLMPILEREKGQLVSGRHNERPYLDAAGLGDTLRGPVSSLGRFYDMLRREGASATGETILPPQLVSQMRDRHRAGCFDETLQDEIDFGLGVIVNSRGNRDKPVAYGFGRHASESTFGHGGAQCAMGFCDPERSLVVAWATNGLCGEGQHQRRNTAINEAIYEDLGLSA